MARNNRKANRGSSVYAQPTTVGNGTLSYEMDATSTLKDVTVRDVLEGCGIIPTVVKVGNAPLEATSSSSGGSVTFSTGSAVIPANTKYYLIPAASYGSTVDAVKISSVTVGPNAGTRLPAEVNFYDGQLFRCDNAMKPTKVKPSDKSPAGLWHDAADYDFKLFSLKGSNTANPVRVGVALRQF